MIKKFARLFLVFLTAGILFTSCPTEYAPHVPPPFVPPDNAVIVYGESGGYGYLQSGYEGDFVRVTFFFYEGALLNIVYNVERESYGPAYPEFTTPVVAWRARILSGGIAAIPPIFPFDYEGIVEIRPWPPAYQPYFDTLSGATITVNALTRAAHIALARLPPGFFD